VPFCLSFFLVYKTLNFHFRDGCGLLQEQASLLAVAFLPTWPAWVQTKTPRTVGVSSTKALEVFFTALV